MVGSGHSHPHMEAVEVVASPDRVQRRHMSCLAVLLPASPLKKAKQPLTLMLPALSPLPIVIAWFNVGPVFMFCFSNEILSVLGKISRSQFDCNICNIL